ncbi:ATP-binding protein [Deinococcus ruber]|uniref:Transcriptional activator n=1 Tax=Deinococcus ruber TaxID=1848197 RepID=A0A918C5U2_9DEIO|nr:BTAD domain-containing putative transcriptional regulator [Deinococcus ruber]GGR06503.1 transcriptional activator [Deinococcus ruber]
MHPSSWRIQVIGQARIAGPGDAAPAALERKLAACVAYLALEGATPRSRLVGLFWPDSPEATARNNLSQMLRKLRLATGTDLITGTDELCLIPDLSVDARQARDAFTQGRLQELLSLQGDFLQHLRYDDCPDLDDWITAERERLLEWRSQALRAVLTRAEREGDYAQALELARTLLDLDPVSEEAHRHVMRLHYLHGDRPAALRAYRRCQEVLRREFGVSPLPETVQLAREIDRGTVPVLTPHRAVTLPLAVQRPPHLVGREREWAQMEAVWDQVLFIYLRGAPGSGKTRLAQDFAASKGEYVVYGGRPGDTQVPFASSARNARTVLDRFPDVPLQEWVRREMARVLPELALPAEVLTPLSSEADVLRLRQAMQVFFAERTAHLACALVDDWQFYDYDSNQDGVFMWTTPLPQGVGGRMPKMIVTYRPDEVTPESEALIGRLVEQGLGVFIDLEPLQRDDIELLMDDLGVPPDPRARDRLRSHSGGNPLFLLETVKYLLESGQFEGGLPERLPLPPKVGQLIERRLALLSPPALQAVRAAAVLQRDFDVELVAQVLGAPLFDLLGAWEELESAQIMRGESFSHDLVYEAVRQGVPASIWPLLHRGAARALEGQGAHPARIATHWLGGGKPALAAPCWLAAAETARARYLTGTVADNLGQAGDAFWAAGNADAAFDAWMQQAEELFYLERLDDFLACAEAMQARASTLRQRGIVQRLISARHWMHGDADGAVRAADLGLTYAVQAADLRLEAELLELRGAVSLQSYPSQDLHESLERMMVIGNTLNDRLIQAKAHIMLSTQFSERELRVSLHHAEAGERLFRSLHDSTGVAACAQKAASAYLKLGDLGAVRGTLARKAAELAQGDRPITQQFYLLESQAHCDYAQGHYRQALAALGEALSLEVMHGPLWRPGLRAWRATVLADLGASDEALAEVRTVLCGLPTSLHHRLEVRVLSLDVLAALGQWAEAAAALSEAQRVPHGGVYWGARLELARAALLPPAERLPILNDVLRRSREDGLRGLSLAAEVRRNAARLALNLAPLPWEADPTDHPAGVIGLPEWLSVRVQVAAALGPQQQAEAWSAFRTWTVQAVRSDVPPEYRAAFLRQARIRSVVPQSEVETLPSFKD